MLYIPSQCSL